MDILSANNLKSREVLKSDLPYIESIIKDMATLCNKSIGIYKGGKALAHCQVNNIDPLRFFVLSSGEVFINPSIIGGRKNPTRRTEGCLSFPMRRPVSVLRFEQIDVVFYDLNLNECRAIIKGDLARIFQHEIDHFSGVNIYGVKK